MTLPSNILELFACWYGGPLWLSDSPELRTKFHVLVKDAMLDLRLRSPELVRAGCGMARGDSSGALPYAKSFEDYYRVMLCDADAFLRSGGEVAVLCFDVSTPLAKYLHHKNSRDARQTADWDGNHAIFDGDLPDNFQEFCNNRTFAGELAKRVVIYARDTYVVPREGTTLVVHHATKDSFMKGHDGVARELPEAWRLDYLEADFAAVHWAYVFRDRNVKVKTRDGDTWVSLLLDSYRRGLGGGATGELWWTRNGGVSVDVNRLWRAMVADARVHATAHGVKIQHPVETAIVVVMACGNDYVDGYNLGKTDNPLPGVGAPSVLGAFWKRYHQLAPGLVKVSNVMCDRTGDLVSRSVQIDLDSFLNLVATIYKEKHGSYIPGRRDKNFMLSRDEATFMWARISWAMMYFTNEPNNKSTHESCLKKRNGVSLYGYALEDETAPPNKENMRFAHSVYTPGSRQPRA